MPGVQAAKCLAKETDPSCSVQYFLILVSFWSHGKATEYTCRHFNMESKCGEICHFPWWFKSCKAMIKSLLLFFACNVFWQGNSWHTFSPDARICSPTGTQVSRVFKGLRIKRNNSKKTETTPPPPKEKPQTTQSPQIQQDVYLGNTVRSTRAHQLLYSCLVGLEKWRICPFPWEWDVSGFSSQSEPCSAVENFFCFDQFCSLQVARMALSFCLVLVFLLFYLICFCF